MWVTKDETPFAAMGYLARDPGGVEHWAVVVRATFDLPSDGLPTVAEDQPPVTMTPTFANEDGTELLAEADFTPFRPKVDLTVRGHATLPGKAAAPMIPVTLALGSWSKTLNCHGPRQLSREGGQLMLTRAKPTDSVPLTWRHTLGGADMIDAEADANTDNPIGTGWTHDFQALPEGQTMDLAPIEDARTPFDGVTTLGAAAGFGAIPPQWHPRLQYAGTYDAAWEATRHPLLPKDFDPQFYQAAPADQQFDLTGGEEISLTNAHAVGPIAFRLPQIILTARTSIGPERLDDRLRLIDVSIDADARQLGMVWTAAIPCQGRDAQVQGSTIRVKQMSGVAT